MLYFFFFIFYFFKEYGCNFCVLFANTSDFFGVVYFCLFVCQLLLVITLATRLIALTHTKGRSSSPQVITWGGFSSPAVMEWFKMDDDTVNCCSGEAVLKLSGGVCMCVHGGDRVCVCGVVCCA